MRVEDRWALGAQSAKHRWLENTQMVRSGVGEYRKSLGHGGVNGIDAGEHGQIQLCLLYTSVVAAVLLAACGSAATPTASSARTTNTTVAPLLVAGRGGTATVALSAIPTTLNDHTVSGDTAATRLVASAVWGQVRCV